jgi:hypothetical protein
MSSGLGYRPLIRRFGFIEALTSGIASEAGGTPHVEKMSQYQKKTTDGSHPRLNGVPRNGQEPRRLQGCFVHGGKLVRTTMLVSVT